MLPYNSKLYDTVIRTDQGLAPYTGMISSVVESNNEETVASMLSDCYLVLSSECREE